MKSIMISYYKRYDSLIWIRLVGELLTGLSGSMLAPFLILYLHQKIGGSILLPLMIVAMQPLTDLVVTFIAGGWADKFGRKPIIMMALSLQLIAMIRIYFCRIGDRFWSSLCIKWHWKIFLYSGGACSNCRCRSRKPTF